MSSIGSLSLHQFSPVYRPKSSSDSDSEHYDFLVAGGGLGGCVAAITAARHGLRVALVQDRPVLGGNSSSEINVCVAGANAMDYNPHARESGIVEEILTEVSARSPERSCRMMDDVLWEWVKRESIDLYLNSQLIGARLSGQGHLEAVEILRSWSGERLTLSAHYFADCTGDAVLAHEAGAKWRMGREAKEEFDESLAPELADRKTLGCTLPFQYRDMGHPVKYTAPPIARDFSAPDSFPDRNHNMPGNHFWWVEWGGELDCIHQYQEIKDELTRIAYGVWDHVKNHGDHGADNYALLRIGHLLGKRESRRVEGDLMLTQNDLVQQRRFEDAVAYGGWPIDLHPPEGVYSKEHPAVQEFVAPYDIPLRCLYARDVENLFLTGRDISVSHVALGSTRVMGTISTMGQAIGTAAAICRRDALTPRQLVQRGVHELQQRLMRDDAYLVGRPNTDPQDLARTSKITATSDEPLDFVAGDEWKELAEGCAQIVPITAGRIDSVQLFLRNSGRQAVQVTLEVHPAQHLYDFGSQSAAATAKGLLEAGFEGWVTFVFNQALPRGLYRLTPDFPSSVYWRRSTQCEPLGTKTGEWNPETESWHAYRGHHRVDTAMWIPFRGCFTFRITPETRPHTGDQVVSGFSRPLDWPNLWVSDPTKPLPQSLTLELPQPVALGQILVTFDTDLDHRVPPRFSPNCVRDYSIDVRSDGQWRTLVEIQGNYHRRRTHDAGGNTVEAVRIQVTATQGSPSARIFEVRLYAAG